MSGGNYPGENYPGANFYGSNFAESNCLGENYPGRNYPGGGQLSKNRINSNMYVGFYHHFQTATTFVDLIPSFKYAYTSLKQSYKTPVKKDLMRIILFRTYKHLKLSVILYIFHVLIIFLIYQTVRSLPSKIESLCSEFCKWF